jgi:hypothetical protein
MAFVVKVRDATGRELASVLIVHNCYLLPDGTEMLITPDVAWCLTCRQFTAVERLLSCTEKEEKIVEQYREGLAGQGAAFVRDAIKYALAQQSAWFEWRARRQSPPRCLEFGLMEFIPVSGWDKLVPHPAEPEMIRVSCTLHVSMATADQQYTPEGLRIKTRRK